ncbi:MAG: RNase adaptor protein RapZ [Deltaproteobacteria bacterium RBG_13_43_22]|nr:MAG: RNase adaptor protein RapZ [Deltaproteobacteria bacterium RBG_13_43_22]
MRLVVITGLSGSGKSTALKAFEDVGFFCIDNLPATLLPRFLELRDQISREVIKIALVMDLRGKDFLASFPKIFQEVKRKGYIVEVLFLEAEEEILIRRFSQTRRHHPLGEHRTLSDTIRLERKKMEPIKRLATFRLDTSHLNVHQLREEILRLFSKVAQPAKMTMNLISFGYKYGLPNEADIVMDVRFLPNPFFVTELKEMDGNQKPVVDYVMKRKETRIFLKDFYALISFLIPQYQKEGKSQLTIAVGCTGGRHRSVTIINALSDFLKKQKLLINIRHRDIRLG